MGVYPISQPQPARNTYQTGASSRPCPAHGAAPPAQVLRWLPRCLLMQVLQEFTGNPALVESPLRPGSLYSPPLPPPTRTPCLWSHSAQPEPRGEEQPASSRYPGPREGRTSSLLDRSRCWCKVSSMSLKEEEARWRSAAWQLGRPLHVLHVAWV